jgi:WD40 repeat protein
MVREGLRFTPERGQRKTDIFAFSPDGKTALSVGIDGAMHLFDAATGKELDEFAGYWKKVLQAAYSKTSRYVTLGLADHSFTIIELATGVEKGRIATPEIVSVMALAPDDGSLAVLGTGGTIRIYQIDGKLLTSFAAGSDRAVLGLAWTAESDGLVVIGEQGMVEVWDPFKPAKVDDLMRHTGSVRAAAITGDGATLATGADDGLVILWDAHTSARKGKLNGLTDDPEAIAWSRDGKRIAVASAKGGFVWDAVIGSMPKTISAPYGGKWVTFTPDGASIVLQGENGPEAFRIPN